jgi:hypothetical protein
MALTETYTNDTGTWGYGPRGGLFCSTCNGHTTVPCTRDWQMEGPFDDGDGLGQYWMCLGCCEPINQAGRGHRRHSCPTCER